MGVSLSEYIRRRRLTLAGFDLQKSNEKVVDIALKYGYDSPNSFTRAFIEMYGITPREARSKGVILKSYPRLVFHISMKGDTEMNYRIEEKGEISLVGISRTLTEENGGAIWDEFFDNGANLRIRDELKLYRPPFWQMGVSTRNENGVSKLFIGAESNDGAVEGLDELVLSAKTWAVFKTKGHIKQLGELWLRIKTEWLPTSGYVYDDSIYVEVYPMDKM